MHTAALSAISLTAELPQSELLARVVELEHRLDDFKKIANQPGPQGPPGPAGKLPRVKEYAAGRVHYESDVVVQSGALWQARGDIVHAPPHSDWICIARAGRNGCDGRSSNVCGTYDARESYDQSDRSLDVYVQNGRLAMRSRQPPASPPLRALLYRRTTNCVAA
jgi:hypothetical protein